MAKGRRPTVPKPRDTTRRQELAELLRGGALTALELSQLAGLREREVTPHLEHLAKSAGPAGERFVVHPAACRSCDYVFEARTRLTRPSRCPSCKGQRVTAPSFELVGEDGA